MEDDLRWKTIPIPINEDDLKNRDNLKMKMIMFFSVLDLLRRRSDYFHRVVIFIYLLLIIIKNVKNGIFSHNRDHLYFFKICTKKAVEKCPR